MKVPGLPPILPLVLFEWKRENMFSAVSSSEKRFERDTTLKLNTVTCTHAYIHIVKTLIGEAKF